MDPDPKENPEPEHPKPDKPPFQPGFEPRTPGQHPNETPTGPGHDEVHRQDQSEPQPTERQPGAA